MDSAYIALYIVHKLGIAPTLYISNVGTVPYVLVPPFLKYLYSIFQNVLGTLDLVRAMFYKRVS